MKRFGRAGLAILLLLFTVLVGAVLLRPGGFKPPLVAAVREADRIEVVAQRGWHPEGEMQAPFVLEGRDKIEGLLERLDFESSSPMAYCMCGGDTAIEFLDGGAKLATLTYHHGTHLRWHGGPWGTDVYLTPDSQVRLTAWFRDQGYERLHSMRGERLEEEKREEDETARFHGCFPNGRIEDIEGKGLARAVFRAFSATSMSWNSTGDKERRAIEALSSVTETEFLEALSEIESDRKALLGFARFFFFEDHDRRIPEDEREEWALRLADVVLQEGLDGDKHLVMRHLWSLETKDADALLRSVLDGKYPPVRSAEDDYGEPGLPAEAALGLALRGDDGLKERIRSMLGGELTPMDRAALEVALGALGNPFYLKKEHFKFRSYSVGFGGLRAIEGYGGAHGMDVLVHGAFEHSWAAVAEEAILVFERITGHTVWNRAPRSRASWHGDAAAAWWKENGEAFVQERRAATNAKEKRE